MLTSLIVLVSVFATTLAQDQPAPSQFNGVWTGQLQQTWAQINPEDPISLQCVSQTVSASPSTLKISGFNFSLSSQAPFLTAIGSPPYTYPGSPGISGTFASYSGTTASIRVGGPGGILQCISIQRSGNQLTTVLLGGSGFSVEDQCNPNAASVLVPNGFSAPFCNPSGPNNAPFQSTVLGIYTCSGSCTANGAITTSLSISLLFSLLFFSSLSVF